MTVTIDFTPSEEARLLSSAQEIGVDPADVIKRLAGEYLPQPERHLPAASSPEDKTLDLLASWIAAAPTEPDEIQDANRDLEQFMNNINADRKRAGARMMYPEVE